MRLYLINPASPLAMSERRQRWFNRYRVWKPLGLLTVAALTPADWQITVIDENLGIGDYAAMPRPDVVGIIAMLGNLSYRGGLANNHQAYRDFTAKAERRILGLPVSILPSYTRVMFPVRPSSQGTRGKGP